MAIYFHIWQNGKTHRRAYASPLFLCYNSPPMLVKLKTFSLLGIDAVPVEVEVDCADIGMPKIILVGLPEAAVKESTYRIDCNTQGAH